MQGKRPLHHDPGNLLMLDVFDLGVLGVLGVLSANLFPDPKGVRAKDAKLAKG